MACTGAPERFDIDVCGTLPLAVGACCDDDIYCVPGEIVRSCRADPVSI